MKKTIVLAIVCNIAFWAASLSISAQISPKNRTLSQKRNLFATGVQLFQEKQYEKSTQIFEQLTNQYPELQDYVQFFLASTYKAQEKNVAAFALFQRFLRENTSHPLRDEVRLTAADLLCEMKKYSDAIDMYEALLSDSTIHRGEIYYKLGQAFLQTNNAQKAAFAFSQAVFVYPQSSIMKEAQNSLRKILTAHQEFAPEWTEKTLLESANILLEKGFYTSAISQFELFQKQYPKSSSLGESKFGMADAYLRLGKASQGKKTLEELSIQYAASQPELAAKAIYTLGVKDWNADRNTQAKHQMHRIVKDFRETSWGNKACYVLGRIFQSQKAYEAAAQWYAYLYKRYPESAFAEEALWRAGWSYYLTAKYPQAIHMFSQAISTFPHGDFYGESFYWRGRSFEQQKKGQKAIETYRRLVKVSPDAYYGIRAQERLRQLGSPVKTSQKVHNTSPEFSSILSIVQKDFSSEMYQIFALRLNKAFELHAVQLQKYARKEIEWIEAKFSEQLIPENDSEKKLLGMYILGRCYFDVGEYLKSIQLAAKIESMLKTSNIQFPYALEHLKYPLTYWELIEKYAKDYSVDPFLIAGIIRQESAYNPKARSYANARGLMQVIPPTAKRIAKQTGLKDFKTAQLYEPETNVLIGTKYIVELLEQFDGNLFRAIAGYNAGPKSTDKWWSEKEILEQEEIVENITYRATRNYVKRVLRNQYNYRAIYSNLSISENLIK